MTKKQQEDCVGSSNRAYGEPMQIIISAKQHTKMYLFQWKNIYQET